eukprot:1156800-Pelagomonas_calceolata.AAC.3
MSHTTWKGNEAGCAVPQCSCYALPCMHAAVNFAQNLGRDCEEAELKVVDSCATSKPWSVIMPARLGNLNAEETLYINEGIGDMLAQKSQKSPPPRSYNELQWGLTFSQ